MLAPLFYKTPDDWRRAEHKAVAVIGMSGVGKTRLAQMLRREGGWFHYSVDYRIGTRYLGERMVDEFKRHAMREPLLREMLMSDSIYIANNISFENLAPLSAWLGKPGDPERGGLCFEEYIRRQSLHEEAEIAALLDTPDFIERARETYGYRHFLCDCGGSLCEVVDPDDPTDPVLLTLAERALIVFIRETDTMVDALCARFARAPKPLYYQEPVLRGLWADYLAQTDAEPDHVDPDAFARYAHRRLIDHRRPLNAAIAANWGVTVEAADIAALTGPEDFDALITRALETR